MGEIRENYRRSSKTSGKLAVGATKEEVLSSWTVCATGIKAGILESTKSRWPVLIPDLESQNNITVYKDYKERQFAPNRSCTFPAPGCVVNFVHTIPISCIH